ncbi:MAG: acetyltransferase [Planctomycetota bacterium]
MARSVTFANFKVMERIAILGAGDLGESLRQYALDRGDVAIAGFLDDARPRGSSFLGSEILGTASDAPHLYKSGAFDRVAFAIGYRNITIRKQRFEQLRAAGVPIYSVVHPSAYVHPTAKIGAGVHIFPTAAIDMAVTVGDNVVFNTGCIIAHHSSVGSHCYFGPGVRVAGITNIGECCFVGIGASIIEKIQIGEGTVVAAGAVVTDNVEPRSLMAGVPAICKKQL